MGIEEEKRDLNVTSQLDIIKRTKCSRINSIIKNKKNKERLMIFYLY